MNLRPSPKDSPDVNLTPLIDVVFLLLIFFMISTTFERESRIEIELPEASSEEPVEQDPQLLDITVDADGRFYVNQQEVINTELETLKRAIAKAVGERRDLPVIISADGRTPHQAVITVMDAASQLGLNKMTFATTQAADRP